MKKIWLFILWLFTLFFAWNITQANDYEYTNLNITANILEDGTIDVKEIYKANFFVSKHWIIRNIPLNYSVGWSDFHIDISNIDVEWQTFTTDQSDTERKIKIWDADKTVIWEQTYPISYTTYGLIRNFSGMWYAELYWNLVWNQFDTNIDNVKAVIYLPKTYTGFSASDFLITTDWKTTSVQDFQWRVNRSHWDRIIITYDKWLSAYEWITLAIKFPNNYFNFDHEKQAWLIGKVTNDYMYYEDANPIVATSIVSEDIPDNSIESDNEELNLSSEELIEDAAHEEENKSNTHRVTSNNYVSSWEKPKLNGNHEYEYTNLDITANVLQDGTINVNENFTADFHVNKHGIIRVIPLNYTPGGYAFHINVKDINVAWKKFTTSKSNWEIEIKIWDPDRTVRWIQSYPISYSTYGLIRNYSGEWYAELYWNLVWNDFDTNINNVKAEILLPKVYTWFTPDDFMITVDWKTTSIYDFQWLVDWKRWDRIIITYDRWLSSYQWITLAIKFPNNYFTFDHKKQAKLAGHTKGISFNTNLESIVESLMPLWIIILFVFTFTQKWRQRKNEIDRKSGKLKWDFAKQFPVIVQYEPPKWVNSAEAWLLLHRGAKPKDMLSLVYKRAAEWLIKLSFEGEEWWIFKKASQNVIIDKISDISPDAPVYEKDFFKALVHGQKNKISETTNLYTKLGLSGLESYGKDKWWLTTSKIGTLVIVAFLGIFILAPIIWETFPALFMLLVLGFFFFVVAVSWKSGIKETEEWARLISHILWYREFLAACDENKLRLFLQQDPLYFDKILPYAVAFGLDTELIKKIEPIMQEMGIKSSRYDWDIHSMRIINDTISSSATHSIPPHYDSGSWFSGWSSFGWGGWWFSSWWWGGWGGWRSW